MNYTFLPYTEQGAMKKEYRLRVLIVLLFFASVGIVIGIVSLFPAYIYAMLEERLHLNEVAAFKKSVDTTSITATQKQLAASSGLLSGLDPYMQKDIYYPTVSAIVSMKGPVQIQSISLDRSNATTMVMSVSGMAPTRSDLLAFKSRLMTLSSKVAVDLPISTLAKNSDISFSLQITQTLP